MVIDTPAPPDEYGIIMDREGVRDVLGTLSPSEQEPISDAIFSLQSNPLPDGYIKVKTKPPIYKYPVKTTDYCLIYNIYENVKQVFVAAIGLYFVKNRS